MDSLSPVLRDNQQLHEEVRGWLKDQKVQEIFMQGNLSSTLFLFAPYVCSLTLQPSSHCRNVWEAVVKSDTSIGGTITLQCNCFLLFPGPYSLNGYRVRVYRQDSATQWFTGIITHHDLFSRNMVVMNDQVHTHTGVLLFQLEYRSIWSAFILFFRPGTSNISS